MTGENDEVEYNEFAIKYDLPPNWNTDYSLERLLPSSHNYRSFKRIPAAPHRYAACVLGGGVFDIQERRFLKPIIDPQTQRRRYRLNQSDHANGKTAAPTRPYYSQIIAELVLGPPKKGTMQAHHLDHDRTRDTWSNIRWTAPEANRRLALQFAGTISNPTQNSRNQKLTYSGLEAFLSHCDCDFHDHHRTPDFNKYAKKFKVCARQLRRIFKEETRANEVQAIRRKLHAARQNNPLLA